MVESGVPPLSGKDSSTGESVESTVVEPASLECSVTVSFEVGEEEVTSPELSFERVKLLDISIDSEDVGVASLDGCSSG